MSRLSMKGLMWWPVLALLAVMATATPAGAQTETDSETDSESDSETESETDSDSETETETDSESETATDSDSDSDSETDSETATDSESETATDSESDSETDSDSETESVSDSATEKESEADTVSTGVGGISWPPVFVLPEDNGGDSSQESGSLWTTLFPELPGDGWTVLGMILVLGVIILFIALVRGARSRLADTGLLPTILAGAYVTLQLLALLTAAGVAARLLPAALAPAVPWAILTVAVAIGWSSRDVLPDVIGAIVIAFEHRIKPGIWLESGGLSGLVERRGLRAVWIRDGHGNRIALPNRRILTEYVAVQETPGPVHEVTIRIDSRRPTREIRRALLEATLSSPWVRPAAAPAVRQDGREPALWHVRAQLLEIRFAARFEGDLLERTEDVLLDSQQRRDDDWD